MWTPATFDIRPISENELPLIEAALPTDPYRAWREDLDSHEAGKVTILVAWYESSPVGSGFIHWQGPRAEPIRMLYPDCPEIFRLAVEENFRSWGIGTALIRHFEALSAARQFQRIGLGVAKENIRAISLYLRLGYHIIENADYIDRWEYLNAEGQRCTVEDTCIFMMKSLVSKAT